MVEGADVASVDLVRMGLEMVIAQGLQALQRRVDLELGGHEGVEGLGIVGGAAGGHDGCPLGELHRFRVITIAPVGRKV
jgi:hypothetical protein